MRWKSRVTPDPEYFDKRIVRKFLIFPRCFGGDTWRWLEYADIVESYERHPSTRYWFWSEIKFYNE